MAGPTHGEKIDELTKVVATLAERLENVRKEVAEIHKEQDELWDKRRDDEKKACRDRGAAERAQKERRRSKSQVGLILPAVGCGNCRRHPRSAGTIAYSYRFWLEQLSQQSEDAADNSRN